MNQVVESLAVKWGNLEVKKAKLAKEEKELHAQIIKEMGNVPDRGTHHLKGTDRKISIVFRRNPSYKDKQALADLLFDSGMFEHDEAESLFNIDIKERTAAVDKFLKDHAGTPAADQLAALRTVNKGKAAIKISSNS